MDLEIARGEHGPAGESLALSAEAIRTTANKLVLACDQVANFESVNMGWDERGPLALPYERRILREASGRWSDGSWEHYWCVAAKVLQHVVSEDRHRGRVIAISDFPDQAAYLAAVRFVREWRRNRMMRLRAAPSVLRRGDLDE